MLAHASRARLKRGWTQGRLFSESGVCQATISEIERRLVPQIGLAPVVLLAKGLGVATGALLEMEANEWAAYLDQLEEI